MSNAEFYAPYVAAFGEATKKRHIHKSDLTTGSGNPQHGVFLQARITPHRSKGGASLVFCFRTAHMLNVSKPMVRVDVSTWSKDYECNAGALVDAMMLIADLTNVWTALVEGTA